MIAKIAVAAAGFAIDKPYSYRIPTQMQVQSGMRVQVPFGHGNRRTEGVVLAVEQGSGEGLKTIDCCLDEAPVLSLPMLQLASFMRERYFCSFFDAIRVMLPAGLWFDSRNLISLTEDRSWQEKTLRRADAAKILQLLLDLGGQAEETALRNALEEPEKLEDGLEYLLRKKWVTSQMDFHARSSDKTEKIATLAASAEEALEYAARRPKSAALQKAVLETLCNLGTVSVKELCYFTGAKTATVKRLADLGYIALSDKPVLRCRQITPAKIDGPLVLNEEQSRAFEGLSGQMQQEHPGSALLYGVTGSGKTAVYLKLIQNCLDAGKSAMLLVPEIALTSRRAKHLRNNKLFSNI